MAGRAPGAPGTFVAAFAAGPPPARRSPRRRPRPCSPSSVGPPPWSGKSLRSTRRFSVPVPRSRRARLRPFPDHDLATGIGLPCR